MQSTRYTRTFIVAVNGEEVARYKGNPGSAYQIATNHAYNIYNFYMERGDEDEMAYEVTVNGRNIKEFI